MAEYTIEDYKRGARAAHAAGDIEAAKRLIAAAKALEGTQPTTPSQPQGPDESVSGALGYGVDNAQKMLGKGIQSVGELTGMEGVEQYGAVVILGIILIGAIGFAIDMLMRWAEKIMVPWKGRG